MNWKLTAGWMFVAVVMAEIAVTVGLEIFPFFRLADQHASYFDVAAACFSTAVIFVFLRWISRRGSRALLPGDLLSGGVVLIATAGFESVLEPLSLGMGRSWPEVNVAALNGLMLAGAVASVSGWIVYVEERIEQLIPSRRVPWRQVGASLFSGAVFCALCVSLVAATREINKNTFVAESRLGVELSNSVARQKGLTERLGRLALIAVETGQASSGVASARSAVKAQGKHFLSLATRYLERNPTDADQMKRFPSLASLRRSLDRVLQVAKDFQMASAAEKITYAGDLQNGIDEFSPLAEQVLSSVAAFERHRDAAQRTVIDDVVTGFLAFLMALGLLAPSLRLSGAQMGKIGASLQEANRLNLNLQSYQRALDDHAIFTVTDRNGKIIQANSHFLKISGFTREEVLSQNHRIVKSNVHSAEFFQDLWNTISSKQSWRGEFCNRASDGRLYWVDACITPLLGHDGRPEQYVCIGYDLTQRKKFEVARARKKRLDRALEKLKTELHREGSIYEILPEVLEELRILARGSAVAVAELGRRRDGQAWGMLIGQCHRNGVDAFPLGTLPVLVNETDMPPLVREILHRGELFGGQSARQIGALQFIGFPIMVGLESVGVLLVDSDVDAITLDAELQATTLALADVFSVRREVGRRRSDELNMMRMAKSDPLTGLGNRRELVKEFDSRTDHPSAQFGLLLIDLDRFKPINDTFGHLVGDTVLRVVSERICAVVKGDYTVCRIGGDEFAILTESRAKLDTEAVMTLASILLEELSQPISCQYHEVSVGASVGVAFYPRDGENFQEVLHCADAAMYRAKTTRTGTQMFDVSMDEGMRFRAELETDLKIAIKSGAIVPNFQPFVDLSTGLVVGHEVLARWNHPKYGAVSPTEFVKVAEEAGLVDKLFWQMLRVSCGKHLEGRHATTLSVNLSPAQINNPIFAKQLVEELEALAFPPHLLEVEITETSMIGDTERARSLLLLLKSVGIQISLDDFGTGHSSLALLRNMPISKLKIDRSFTIDLETKDEKKGALIGAILGIAKAMDLTVTAEGIETSDVAEYLRAHGCQFGQGYLYGKAVPEIVMELSKFDDLCSAEVA